MRRLALVLAALMLSVTACGGGTAEPGGASPTNDRALVARAERFLGDYVQEDGRVLRVDQGRDIVSEGQAYGMLIAELAGDDEAVRRIWGWTREHLRRDEDGLLSFHADEHGTVTDPNFATDADILAAYALLRYDGPDAEALREDGQELAKAVLEHAVAETRHGPVPVAGSWALGPPATVNPSYWMPGVSRGMAHLTGNDRWSRVADATVTLLEQATERGRLLPTDWARLTKDTLHLTEHPDAEEPPRYGPDAQRTPIFFAAGCDQRAVRLAASWWQRLSDERLAVATRLDPRGGVVEGNASPLALFASAATARAAGDDGRADELSARAVEQAAATPTYYGDAWAVLAPAIDRGELSGC